MGGVEVSPWSLPGASRRYLMEHEKSRRWEAVEMAKGGLGRHRQEIHKGGPKDHGLQGLQEPGLPNLPGGLD